jgi:hypothetical protein
MVPKPTSTRFKTTRLPNHPPHRRLIAPLAQVLPLENQTLVNRAGQQGDAVPADIRAEALARHLNGFR